MTKKLLLIRHAKSSWDDASIADVDRPLNSRGIKNAPEMARRLKKLNIVPDVLISSHALRALETARLFAAEFGFAADKIHIRPELYLAGTDQFQSVISSLDDNWNVVALFSHNPGITEMANQLSNARIDNMPTASIFGARFIQPRWVDIVNVQGEFWFFDYPKSKDR